MTSDTYRPPPDFHGCWWVSQWFYKVTTIFLENSEICLETQGFVFLKAYKWTSIWRKLKVLVTPLCLTVCDPMNCSLPGSSVHGDSQGKNTEVGCHVLLQGTFPTQGSNPGLPHCRQILYHLSHQGRIPIIISVLLLKYRDPLASDISLPM